MEKKISVIKETLINYIGPILIIGKIDWLIEIKNVTIVSATNPQTKFIIKNSIPAWVKEIENKKNIENILIIKDLDKIKEEEQKLLLDLLEYNQISNINLPKNLKIILNANQKCNIDLKIRDLVEIYEV